MQGSREHQVLTSNSVLHTEKRKATRVGDEMRVGE